MQNIYSKARSLAKIDTNLIIIGETGTGKKRLAHHIHENSSRADQPFHTFYCIDIDETIYKDAFKEHLHVEDDHIVLKYDAIEKAEHGILFLDQFSELPTQFMLDIVQLFIKSSNQLFRNDKASTPRLILSMKQKEYQKISNTQTWKTLLHQIDSVAIVLPPLRERKEDIPVYIDLFLNDFKKMNPEWSSLNLSDEALNHCVHYQWPGNIPQLRNALFQGAVFSNGKKIKVSHLPFSMEWKLPYELE